MKYNITLRESLSSISAFGVEFRSPVEDDIPLLCYWRNQPELRSFMEHDRIIKEKELQVWLRMVNGNDKFFPYIVYLNALPVAFTELKYIDYASLSYMDGIFLFGTNFMKTGLSLKIILCREIVVKALGLQNLFSKIHKDNIRCIKFCLKCGAELLRTEGCFHVYKYEFHRRQMLLRKIATELGMGDSFEQLLGTSKMETAASASGR